MSSNQSKVMCQVTNAVRFMIEYTQSSMVEELNNQENEYNLNEAQVSKIVKSVERSVNTAYQRSMNEIMRAID